jgi:hypothetical protein
MDPELRETVDYVAIRRLQEAYGDVVTRRAWPELADLFRPDAEVSIDMRDRAPIVVTGPDGIGNFIAGAIERFERFQFVVLGTRVDLAGADPDRATARLYMCELRQSVAESRESIAYGVYHDDYVRHDGRWWFGRRRYHSLARTAADLAVFPFPEPGP